MPKRTNPFQQLIYLIQHQMAGEATVTESKFLVERGTGRRVEVDVVVDGQMSGNPVVIGIECTSSRRRATVEWVDQMIGKHKDLPVDKTILVSKSGFTGEAIKKTQAHGVEALQLREAKSEDWASRLGTAKGLRFAGFSMKADEYSCTFGVVPPVPGQSLVVPSAIVQEPGRSTASLLQEYVNGLCRHDRVFMAASRHWNSVEQNRPESFSFTVTWTCPEGTTLRGDLADPVPLKSIQVKVRATVRDEPLNASASMFRDQNVVHAEIPNVLTADGDTRMLITLLEKNGQFEKGAALTSKPGSQGSRVVEMKAFPPEAK